MNDNVPMLGQEAGVQAQTSQTQIAISREVQEVQGLILAAKNFPRQVPAAITRIKDTCKSAKLAEVAMYEYPRGNTIVRGPSIRLAEVLAQNWGNLDFGWKVIRSDDDSSEIQSVCWDLETNVRQTRVFTVPHIRHTKKGSYKLKDPRDIYEMQANQAARRLRACILAIIPKNIVEIAEEQCDKTLAHQLNKDGKVMSKDVRLARILEAFSEHGVDQDDIERLFKHKFSSLSETEIARLQRIHLSLRDRVGVKEDFFPAEEYEAPEPKKEKVEAQPKQAKDTTEEKSEAAELYLAAAHQAMLVGLNSDEIQKAGGLKGEISTLDPLKVYEAVERITTLVEAKKKADQTVVTQTTEIVSDLDPKSKLDATDGVARQPLKAYKVLEKMDAKASEYKSEVHDMIVKLYDRDLRMGDDVKIAQLVRQAEKGNGSHMQKLVEFLESRQSLVE